VLQEWSWLTTIRSPAPPALTVLQDAANHLLTDCETIFQKRMLAFEDLAVRATYTVRAELN
jgi:hypothetical protein